MIDGERAADHGWSRTPVHAGTPSAAPQRACPPRRSPPRTPSASGSWPPPRAVRPYVSEFEPIPLLASGVGYRPQVQAGYAVVLYATAVGRVGAVIAPFADALSAEEYALDSQFTSYDVVPATTVGRITT